MPLLGRPLPRAAGQLTFPRTDNHDRTDSNCCAEAIAAHRDISYLGLWMRKEPNDDMRKQDCLCVEP